MGWDPASLSYKPARVRENDKRDQQPMASTTPPPHTISASSSSRGVSSGASSDISLWPSSSKCSVRAQHLLPKTMQQIEKMVSHEGELYNLALSLNARLIQKNGERFQAGLKRLKQANEELRSCVEKQESGQ